VKCVQRWLFAWYFPITYYWTGLLMLDHSYLVGNLTNSKIGWNKRFRTSKILTLLYQQVSNLLISQRDMSGPRLGALSNNKRSGGIVLVLSLAFWNVQHHQAIVVILFSMCWAIILDKWEQINFSSESMTCPADTFLSNQKRKKSSPGVRATLFQHVLRVTCWQQQQERKRKKWFLSRRATNNQRIYSC
jgi:hypothetical protein